MLPILRLMLQDLHNYGKIYDDTWVLHQHTFLLCNDCQPRIDNRSMFLMKPFDLFGVVRNASGLFRHTTSSPDDQGESVLFDTY